MCVRVCARVCACVCVGACVYVCVGVGSLRIFYSTHSWIGNRALLAGIHFDATLCCVYSVC